MSSLLNTLVLFPDAGIKKAKDDIAKIELSIHTDHPGFDPWVGHQEQEAILVPALLFFILEADWRHQ